MVKTLFFPRNLLAVLLPFLFFCGLLCGALSCSKGEAGLKAQEQLASSNSGTSSNSGFIEQPLDNISYVAVNLEGITVKDFDTSQVDDNFYVSFRRKKIVNFPCSACHTQEMKTERSLAFAKAHWRINLSHASEKVMNCSTCHQQPWSNNLSTPNGEEVDFNHSYQVCASCHSEKYRDWVGGAHGKRLGGWVEPRVIKSCSACHNPHRPGLVKRRPVISPSIPH